jgi:hypothetical protein
MSTLKASVDEWGHPNMIYPDFSRLGCRPVVSYSSVSSDCSSLHLNENDVYECTYGEYPQTVVSEEEAKELNDLYLNKKLNLTGKTYTCNSSDDDLEHYYDEYEYQGEKYIRVNGNTNFGILLSNNSPIVNNSSYWIKVEPVEWLVDKSADIMISKKILFSGVPLSRNYYYKGSFKKSLLKKYLNNKFSKDIIPTMVLNESSNKILSLNEWLDWSIQNNIHPVIHMFMIGSNGEFLNRDINWNEVSEQLYLTHDLSCLYEMLDNDIFEYLNNIYNSLNITVDNVLANTVDKDALNKLTNTNKYLLITLLTLIDVNDCEYVKKFIKDNLDSKYLKYYEKLCEQCFKKIKKKGLFSFGRRR